MNNEIILSALETQLATKKAERDSYEKIKENREKYNKIYENSMPLIKLSGYKLEVEFNYKKH